MLRCENEACRTASHTYLQTTSHPRGRDRAFQASASLALSPRNSGHCRSAWQLLPLDHSPKAQPMPGKHFAQIRTVITSCPKPLLTGQIIRLYKWLCTSTTTMAIHENVFTSFPCPGSAPAYDTACQNAAACSRQMCRNFGYSCPDALPHPFCRLIVPSNKSLGRNLSSAGRC